MAVSRGWRVRRPVLLIAKSSETPSDRRRRYNDRLKAAGTCPEVWQRSELQSKVISRYRSAFVRASWLGTALALVSLSMLLTFPASASAADERRARTIEVTGEGQVEVPPDLALLDFGVVTRAPTAAAAARENSGRMERVLAALRKAAGSDATLSTGAYSIRPVYAPPSREQQEAPRITGYEVSNVVHLKTKAIPRLGEAIDAAIGAGANQVQRLVFTVADDSEARRAALGIAARQAREKAEALAAALRVKLGAVRSLVEQELGGARPLARGVAMQEAASFTPVEPGTVDVRARVVLTMDIADAGQTP
jgi:uncharacterized protein